MRILAFMVANPSADAETVRAMMELAGGVLTFCAALIGVINDRLRLCGRIAVLPFWIVA